VVDAAKQAWPKHFLRLPDDAAHRVPPEADNVIGRRSRPDFRRVRVPWPVGSGDRRGAIFSACRRPAEPELPKKKNVIKGPSRRDDRANAGGALQKGLRDAEMERRRYFGALRAWACRSPSVNLGCGRGAACSTNMPRARR